MARDRLALALALTVGLGSGLGGGCKKAESVPAGQPLAGKAFYRVDPGPTTPCATGSTCELRLVLTALGDYHVNKDYPFKFVADPAGAPVDGDGSFALDGEKRGTMTIKFRPAAAGNARVVGSFKLSVCSDDTCEIEAPRLELSVPVS
jgi:hypothetical protein